jgi:hypothetical protein
MFALAWWCVAPRLLSGRNLRATNHIRRNGNIVTTIIGIVRPLNRRKSAPFAGAEMRRPMNATGFLIPENLASRSVRLPAGVWINARKK